MMLEFLIRATDGGDLWPGFPAHRHADVLLPAGWGAAEIDGWGDFRMLVEGVEVSFSGEEVGWQVAFEGEIDRALARSIVDTIASQVSTETNRPVRVIEI